MPTAIIDLSYLRASGRDGLQKDLGGYTILLTSELVYEVSTDSDRGNSWPYFKKLDGLNLVHSRSLINLVKEEIKTSQRVGDVLHSNSKRVIDVLIDAKGVGAQQEVQDFFEKDEPKDFKKSLDRMWDKKHDGIFMNCKAVDAQTDAKEYLALFAPPEAKDIRGKTIAKYHHMKHAPEPGWLIYDWELLRNFLAFRYRLNGTRSCQLSNKKLANSLADLTYLAFIPRVDAIATQDVALIRPLARVFGPPNLKIVPLWHDGKRSQSGRLVCKAR
jgi:hypothetical protein